MSSSFETPTLENLQGQQQASGDVARFVISAIFDHWKLLLFGFLVGFLLFGGVSMARREVGLDTWETYSSVVIRPSHWDTDLLKDVSGAGLLPITATGLVERTNLAGLADDVARAIIQHDIAGGGPLSQAVTDSELQERAESIRGKIQLVALDESNTVRITVSGCARAEEAQNIAEYTARVFLEQNRQLRMEQGRDLHNFIVEQLQENQKLLAAAESAEWAFKQESGFRNYGTFDQDMASMEDELGKLKIEREETQARIQGLAQELEENRANFADSLNFVTDNVAERLFHELNELLQNKLAMSSRYQESYPGLLELEEEILEKKRAILEAVKQLDSGIEGGSDVWVQRQKIYQQQIDLQVQLTGIEIREAALQRRFQELIPKIPELTNKKHKYDQLVQERESIRTEFARLSEREWELRSALNRGGGQLERMESVPSPKRIPPVAVRNIWMNFLLGGLSGMLCCFCYAMLQEVNDTSIRSIEDVNKYIGLEVIGTIPKMRFGKPRRFQNRRRRATYVTTVDEEQIDACIVTQHDPKSPISEAYRTLRTNFQFATLQLKPRTVMITSAVPGEGKTTTVANMAVTMADRGVRVLIVDTDLRRPNVHRVMRMERGPGLADILREDLDPRSVIRQTRVENLWIISSGRVPPNPSELIGSERMAKLMQKLGEEFDLVICDAPSVLVVTDPVLLATHVDTCIVVVSTNNARRETVIRAKKLLETANVDVAGVVVNGLETTRRYYYYYYYYYDDGAPTRRKWYHF
ncbi:MAG: polysaccharide biosynthesis tyrosine autokinase [Candidatus Hydrogenedentes bacterium]|nr:polysaccharide biosynthesis tyrosine autokinase [Candidatus Hydrogenedentota bacterium]